MATKNKAKEGFTIKIEYTPHLPNEAHRAEKWAGGQVQKNRKKYRRKSKHQSLPLEKIAQNLYYFLKRKVGRTYVF